MYNGDKYLKFHKSAMTEILVSENGEKTKMHTRPSRRLI